MNIDNNHTEIFFLLPFLNHVFIRAPYKRFSIGPAQARKQSIYIKSCCFFKIKDQIILFKLAGSPYTIANTNQW